MTSNLEDWDRLLHEDELEYGWPARKHEIRMSGREKMLWLIGLLVVCWGALALGFLLASQHEICPAYVNGEPVGLPCPKGKG